MASEEAIRIFNDPNFGKRNTEVKREKFNEIFSDIANLFSERCDDGNKSYASVIQERGDYIRTLFYRFKEIDNNMNVFIPYVVNFKLI